MTKSKCYGCGQAGHRGPCESCEVTIVDVPQAATKTYTNCLVCFVPTKGIPMCAKCMHVMERTQVTTSEIKTVV